MRCTYINSRWRWTLLVKRSFPLSFWPSFWRNCYYKQEHNLCWRWITKNRMDIDWVFVHLFFKLFIQWLIKYYWVKWWNEKDMFFSIPKGHCFVKKRWEKRSVWRKSVVELSYVYWTIGFLVATSNSDM